jgi:flagellar biogenesis protein FliO
VIATVWFRTAPADQWTLLDPQLVDYFRLLLVLGAVLILAYVGVRYLVPRMTGMRQVPSGPMRVVARLPIEPGKNLYLVKAGTCCFLVGTSAGDIHYLASLDAEAVGPLPDPGDSRPEFGRLLKSLRGSKE